MIRMPQVRYYHHGRYYRPARPMPLLPPLSLVPAVDPSKHAQLRLGNPADDYTVTRRWKSKRDKEFRWMVRYIGDSLTGENVADMRFLCRDHIHPPDILRRPMNGMRLMSILEQHRLLAENSLFFLQTTLYYIARPDLYEMVHDFRAKRQNDFRKMGVEIMFDMKNPNERGLALSKDVKSFRKCLKPRSRFNNVDIQTMSKRLAELKARMQSQLPKPLDRSYANSVLSTSTSMMTKSDAGDSDWTDVDDSENEKGDDDERSEAIGEAETNLKLRVVTEENGVENDNGNKRDRKSRTRNNSNDEGSNKRSGDVNKKEVLRLPDIRKKTTLEVTVKTGREGESEYDAEEFEDDDETLEDGTTIQDGTTLVDGTSEAHGHRTDRSLALSLAGDSPVRILGPAKPVRNFTHRSSEFTDLKISGRQTYNDDDITHVQANKHDIGHYHGSYNRDRTQHDDQVRGDVAVKDTKVASDANAFESAVLGEAANIANQKPKVPLKIRTLRKRFRKHSPVIRAATNNRQVRRHTTPKNHHLPIIKTPNNHNNTYNNNNNTNKSSGVFAQLKTTINVPKHDPQRMNFLPDIYDKYARRSVSSSTTTKTQTTKKSKKR